MKNFKLISDLGLSAGDKITLVSTNELGFVYCIPMTYDSCQVAPHYYNCPEEMNGVAIRGVPKRKRSMYQLTISYNSPLLIYSGWPTIDVEGTLYNTKTSGDTVMKTSKYTSFDKRNITDIAERYPDNILVLNV